MHTDCGCCGGEVQREADSSPQRRRAEIERLTADFLANGGKVTSHAAAKPPAARTRVKMRDKRGDEMPNALGKARYECLLIRVLDEETGEVESVARPLPFPMW